MYLARLKGKNRPYFQIRRSVASRGKAPLVSQTLFHLGSDPRRFIVYPGGNAFYIREEVEEALERQGIRFDYAELEALFWPFVDPEIRFKLEPFVDRGGGRKGKKKASAEEFAAVHQFDRQRLYYLRCGGMDKSDLVHITDRLFAPLVGKCRDELEQYFMQLELSLRARELKGYVYAAFDLQRFFPNWMFARTMPETIEEDKLDAAFLEAYCLLDCDASLWTGLSGPQRRADYLNRYLFMFFDHPFPGRSPEEQYLRDFINARRRYSPPQRKTQVAAQEVEELFGRSLQELREMGKSSLNRLFRKRAKALHPDKGGSHEIFVRLTAVYEELRRAKGA